MQYGELKTSTELVRNLPFLSLLTPSITSLMSIIYSPGCGNHTVSTIPVLNNGSNICYFNIVVTEISCIRIFNNMSTVCQCDASDNCVDRPSSSYNFTSGWPDYPLLTVDSLPCNGRPIAFPPTGSPNVSISGSCTYTKANPAAVANTVNITGSISSAGITLTKSNMLIAASLVLCAVIGSL